MIAKRLVKKQKKRLKKGIEIFKENDLNILMHANTDRIKGSSEVKNLAAEQDENVVPSH